MEVKVSQPAIAGVVHISSSARSSLAIKGGVLLAWGLLPYGATVPQAATLQGVVCWAFAGKNDAIVRNAYAMGVAIDGQICRPIPAAANSA
jgi:hypothetical protein